MLDEPRIPAVVWWALMAFGLFYGWWIARHPKQFLDEGRRYRPKWLGDLGWEVHEIRFVGWVFAGLCALALILALWSLVV